LSGLFYEKKLEQSQPPLCQSLFNSTRNFAKVQQRKHPIKSTPVKQSKQSKANKAKPTSTLPKFAEPRI
tara:strand:- start:15686 stop:15892 length:207 start_codon:yes stop_codon:yes gene_type:complete